MVDAGWLDASVSTLSETPVVSTETGRGLSAKRVTAHSTDKKGILYTEAQCEAKWWMAVITGIYYTHKSMLA